MKRRRFWGTVFDRLFYTFKPFSERFSAVQITRDEKSGWYKANCRFWDYIKGIAGRTVHEYQTEQEAIDSIAAQHSNRKRVIIIFDDDGKG